MTKPNMMTKADMTALLALHCELSQERAGRALDALFDAIAKGIAAGDRVRLPELGAIEAHVTAPRQGRNPHTGEALAIPAGHRFTFTAGRALKGRMPAVKPAAE